MVTRKFFIVTTLILSIVMSGFISRFSTESFAKPNCLVINLTREVAVDKEYSVVIPDYMKSEVAATGYTRLTYHNEEKTVLGSVYGSPFDDNNGSGCEGSNYWFCFISSNLEEFRKQFVSGLIQPPMIMRQTQSGNVYVYDMEGSTAAGQTYLSVGFILGKESMFYIQNSCPLAEKEKYQNDFTSILTSFKEGETLNDAPVVQIAVAKDGSTSALLPISMNMDGAVFNGSVLSRRDSKSKLSFIVCRQPKSKYPSTPLATFSKEQRTAIVNTINPEPDLPGMTKVTINDFPGFKFTINGKSDIHGGREKTQFDVQCIETDEFLYCVFVACAQDERAELENDINKMLESFRIH